MSELFKKLTSINVNDKTEKKKDLTYLSWAWAWDIFKKECPDATYEIIKNSDGFPYFESHAGVMVYTKVTVLGETHQMWLPVMDGANKSMKKEAYNYKTQYGEKTVEPFSMFDVNKTLMRCLVKNLAMFGFALYIYAGEDLPEGEEVAKPEIKPSPLDAPVYYHPIPERIEELKEIATEIVDFHTKGLFDDAFVIFENVSDSSERNELWKILKPNSAVRTKITEMNNLKKAGKQ